MTNDKRRTSLPFFALGAAFFAVGIAGNRTFIFVCLAFWLVALMTLLRARR